MRYKVTFLDYWHLSSGLSAGAKLDSTVTKDKDGLPYIAGKTIKGLLREVAELTDNKDFVFICFGSSSDEKDDFYSEEKIVSETYFSNAQIEENTRKKIVQDKLQNQLFDEISSTKIDENGIAETGSLRQIEVVIPITLYGSIENIPENYEKAMENCLKQIKRMGLNRNRGLGRCKIEVVGDENEKNRF
ncbi:RAMP superfamily CRISPR-associated protein [Aliarcobacter lanthieri]|uniref:RAMP superfamily CRISPR-associated protein n=1 Tax=Aliarcobacter lanthieri TaxID=1355374 RepID=UPI003AADDCEB